MTNPHHFQKGRYPIKTNVKICTVPAQFWLDSMASRAWNIVPIFLTWLSSVTQTSVPMALLGSSSLGLRPVPCYLSLIAWQLLEGCGFTFLEFVWAGCGGPGVFTSLLA